MLIITKVELKLFLNADVYLLLEKGMRGGVSSILRPLVNPTKSIKNLMTRNENQMRFYT